MAEDSKSAKTWEKILKLQLDGVMMHTVLFERYKADGIEGYALMHKHHAEEEFENYLHVLGDFIEKYAEIPLADDITAPSVDIDGTTVEEKMVKGMRAYENWEIEVCAKLEILRDQFEDAEDQCHANKLVCKVCEELSCINLMENDLYQGKYEELNNWLIKKWGD